MLLREKRRLGKKKERAVLDAGRPHGVSKADYAAENRLRPLIPASFVPTPGFEESSLWHAAIKYVAHVAGTRTQSPFEGPADALGDSFAAKDGRAKEVLRKIIPKPYLKAQGRRTPLAESMKLYMRDLKSGKGFRLPMRSKDRFTDLSYKGRGKFSSDRMARVHEEAKKAMKRAKAVE